MIAQGTDGISRGSLNEGVMDGQTMLDFIPIHLSAFERSGNPNPWLASWLLEESVYIMDPMDWLFTGHGISGFEVDPESFERPILSSDSTYVWVATPSLRSGRGSVGIAKVSSEALEPHPHFCLPAFVHCSVASSRV